VSRTSNHQAPNQRLHRAHARTAQGPDCVREGVPLKLSICIPTRNRAQFIGPTLESILWQLTDQCEIVVLDGASTDNTADVVQQYAKRCSRVRYCRLDTCNGFDRDCDIAVEVARGEYCWLMTDDDLIKPGAVDLILQACQQDLSLIVVNVEARDLTMTKVLQPRWIDIQASRTYTPEQMEELFVEAAAVLKYVGSVIIRRTIWLTREKRRYYGSWFTYLGVVFQERLPGNALVIAEPCVSYRKGNAHCYSSGLSEIWFSKMPVVLASLTTVSAAAKNKFWMTKPWTDVLELLRLRALGIYSMVEYRRWIRPQLNSIREALMPICIALLPGLIVNASRMLYYAVTRRHRGVWRPELELQMLRESRYFIGNLRIFRRT